MAGLIVILTLGLWPFAKISLLVTAVVVLAWQSSYRWWLGAAFWMGLIADVYLMRPLGGSSLILMTLGFIIYFVREQFDLTQGWLVALSGVMGEGAWRLATRVPLSWGGWVTQAVIVWIIWQGWKHWAPNREVFLKPGA